MWCLVPASWWQAFSCKRRTYWATYMKRVFEIEPLERPRCAPTMKIKAFIQEQSEINRLSENLGEIPWRAPPPLQHVP